ncbi:MAG: protein kinase [Polyangiaceae bacterium]|nr:protein kinase [Polyangiaceae bacterium]
MASHPTELAGFEILHRLGAGGMAEVFLAKKRGAEGTYKLLVVKRILPQHSSSRRFRQMFVEEAHLATRLNHPNIVQVYEFSDHGDEGLLLSMEHVDGCDLGRLMSAARAKNLKIPPYVAAFIIAEAAKGLHYAHERKDESETPLAIVHRDVSPQNILVSFDGVVKIADFGIASANLFREEPGVLKGKFGYMSPEQARGEKIDRRSDVYSLGVVFYELLTLRSPYGKLDDDALLAAVRTPEIPAPRSIVPDLPPDLEAIVMRALGKSISDRFPTARDLSAAIARAFIARQELVDHTAVEKTLQTVLGSDARTPSVKPGKPDEPQTLAAVPLPRGGHEAPESLVPPRKVVNEVRHVAVVTLRIDGLPELSVAIGAPAAKRALDSIRATLDDIAYKRGAVWSWDGDNTARAVVGLLSNPSRAPVEAASLAVDSHEALAGASQDLPVTLRAAIGIVRGIASGERDDQGHLQHHVLQAPAGYLSDELGWRTPFGKTYVAGGVYRVVRRDFRWAEAPSLDMRGADLAVPAQMRVYALVRPLSREERTAELALLPNDLVGRDAEKADLHAALHAALSTGDPHSVARSSSRISGSPSFGPVALSSIPPRLSDLPRDAASPERPPSDNAPRDSRAPDTGARPPSDPSEPRRPSDPTEARRSDAASLIPKDSSPRSAAEAALRRASEPPRRLSDPPPAQKSDKPPTEGTASILPAVAGKSPAPDRAPPTHASPRLSTAPEGALRHKPINLLALDDVGGSVPPPTPEQAFDSPAPSAPAGLGGFRGHLVARVITGEMGIGKSALVATFLSELPPTFRILSLECSPVKSELPFGTTADMLRAATGLGTEHSLAEAKNVIRQQLGPAGRHAQSVQIAARLAELCTGKHEEALDDEAAGYRREQVVAGVRMLFGAMARLQPLVVVIDSLQWADRPSLELLQDLLRRTDSAPILLLLIARPDDRVAPFVSGLVQIELRGLSPEEQMRLVEARLGVRDGVAAVCGELVPKVAGNPFFLLEMIDALLERGALEIVEREGGRHELIRHDRGGEAGLPSTLEQLIGDRLRELPSAERDIVSWLAVAAGPLSEPDLLHLVRLESDEAITRLCARGLVDRKGGAVDFRHPLVRDVAYLAMDPQARARSHRLLGEHLATTALGHGLAAAIVAGHLARGQSPSAAADFYLEAADSARSAHHAQLGQRYYHLALNLMPSGDQRRLAAHEGLEAIYRHLGRRKERRRHLLALRRLAQKNGTVRWACLALVRTARLDLDEGYFARGLPITERATELARAARLYTLEVESLLLLSEILRSLGDIQGALSATERALAVAENGRLPARSRAEVLRSKGVLLRYVGRVREAVETYAEAIAVFRKVGARRAEARAKNSLAFAMFVMERFEDTIAVANASVAIDLAIGGRFQIAKTLSNIGQAYARLGDLETGLAYMRQAREAHERYGDQDSRADTLLSFAAIVLEMGDVDTAETLVGDAGALIAVTGSMYDSVHEHILRALVCRARGDADAGCTYAAEARRLSESQGLMSYHIYAQAIEGACRVDAGELHTGVLLARTALGAIEAAEASEYGIEVRAICVEGLRKASPTSSRDAVERAAAHVRDVAVYIKNERLRALFFQRPLVDRILFEEREIQRTAQEKDPSRASLALRHEAPIPNPTR